MNLVWQEKYYFLLEAALLVDGTRKEHEHSIWLVCLFERNLDAKCRSNGDEKSQIFKKVSNKQPKLTIEQWYVSWGNSFLKIALYQTTSSPSLWL